MVFEALGYASARSLSWKSVGKEAGLEEGSEILMPTPVPCSAEAACARSDPSQTPACAVVGGVAGRLREAERGGRTAKQLQQIVGQSDETELGLHAGEAA